MAVTFAWGLLIGNFIGFDRSVDDKRMYMYKLLYAFTHVSARTTVYLGT